ncbi:9851_t:CDS:2, partial [Gigaspora rosea]
MFSASIRDKGDKKILETNTRNKSEEHIDIIAKFKACHNRTTIENLWASFEKLFRIGTLGGTAWTKEIPTKPCHYVLPGTTNDQGSMSLVSKYDEQNDAFCDNILMVVDIYANDFDHCNIASFIGCKLPSDRGYGPNTGQMLWSMGKSLEEARLKDVKDNLNWIVLNNRTVEEFELSLELPELSK